MQQAKIRQSLKLSKTLVDRLPNTEIGAHCTVPTPESTDSWYWSLYVQWAPRHSSHTSWR